MKADMVFNPYRLFSITPPHSVVSKRALAGEQYKPPSGREVEVCANLSLANRRKFRCCPRLKRADDIRPYGVLRCSGSTAPQREAERSDALGSLVYKTNLRFLLRELSSECETEGLSRTRYHFTIPQAIELQRIRLPAPFTQGSQDLCKPFPRKQTGIFGIVLD